MALLEVISGNPGRGDQSRAHLAVRQRPGADKAPDLPLLPAGTEDEKRSQAFACQTPS